MMSQRSQRCRRDIYAGYEYLSCQHLQCFLGIIGLYNMIQNNARSCFIFSLIVVLSLLQFLHGIEVVPATGNFGAYIHNTDVENISNNDFDILHEALLRHKVIIVRNQAGLSVEGQRRFTKRFGPLHVHLESSSHLPGYTDVNVVSNIKNANGSYIGLFGAHVENFHSDLSWAHIPTKITVLKSVIRPSECGDTIFADTHAAYHELPDSTKQQLHGLRGHYCYLKLRELSADGKAENLDIAEIQSAAGCAVHPLVTTHPITGVKNLYANPSHTASVLGYEKEASEALLQQLFAHTAQEKYAFRHVYQDDDLILWDNRAVHHRATGCPNEFPRKLVRTTVSNDHAPVEGPLVGATLTDPSVVWDLSLDRVNAEASPVHEDL